MSWPRFRKSKDFNCALIAKITWMFTFNRDSLCMRSKVRSNWLRNDLLKNVSPIWRAIEKAKNVISKGACFLVGDEKSIDVLLDP